MRATTVGFGLGCVLASSGCSDDGINPFDANPEASSGNPTGGLPTEDPATTAITGAGSSGGGETTVAADTTAGPIFDVGGNEEGGPVTKTCTKVDVLYIIDNSPSMYDEQQTLIANFGNFVADMQRALSEVDDYHIGVITTDDYIDGGGLFDDGADTVNQSYPACQSLGGLVVEAQAGSCLPFAAAGNFISEADDLATKFSCIANVGEDGDSDEQVGDALITFLASQLIDNAVSDCNAGFVRNDALLIIVILTDENDSSGTGPAEWYQAVVNAKGVETNAVVLSLVWDDSEPNCSSNLSETNGYTIVDFTEMFTHHSVGNICDGSYAGFFVDTVPVIDGACDEFEPAG